MKKPDLMETVFRYVNACDRRNWRPVFTLEQFRAIYQAVIGDPTIPNTDALPPDRERVTLYGVAITVSSAPRPEMPEDMLDRDSPVDEPERVRQDQDRFNRQMAMIAARFPAKSVRSAYDPEPHDLPPRSM